MRLAVAVLLVFVCALSAGWGFHHDAVRHDPSSDHARIADYLGDDQGDVSPQCLLPLSERTGGWFC